jgi:LmbE family N-acetylglucosaminyl deacetylase
MLAGGILSMLAKGGFSVHYLCATRGEGGEVGEPAVCTREQLGEVREQELVYAVQALGGRSLTFLGYRDPPIGPNDELHAYTNNLTMLAGQVAASIRQHDPVAIITHGSNGEYGHPAHILTYTAARIAAESLGTSAPLLYSVMADFPDHPRQRLANQADPAHLVVDITPGLAQKEKAALCHRTQHALFVRRRSQELGHPVSVPEALMRVESLHRHLPATQGTPDDPVAHALAEWVMR